MPTTTPSVQLTNPKHPHAGPPPRAIIATLRALIPRQPVRWEHSLRLAKQQAIALMREGRSAGLTPIELITELPRIRIEYSPDQQIAHASFWDIHTRQWVISLRRADSWKRHRIYLAHEFKRVLDHGRTAALYPSPSVRSSACAAERAADYFARHLLVPDQLLRRALRAGFTEITALAAYFDVPDDLIRERLYDERLHTGSAVPGRPSGRAA
ncbi:hypothetical protein B7C42_00210 [Nocardia cerradoensis]|uniref:IrrE N-terminal-like domain-containing protein n=1 Tax=Nocardia cerradoensis TaxID=85688 RepID=A0A231HE91_9NOCA|nr:ImmA/IrrE family metallo-endopeptidase [Nocardia cerradoensis]OXR47088.1 hypothetical protein B7C42_00210 [Nocardia cerradoensis]